MTGDTTYTDCFDAGAHLVAFVGGLVFFGLLFGSVIALFAVGIWREVRGR